MRPIVRDNEHRYNSFMAKPIHDYDHRQAQALGLPCQKPEQATDHTLCRNVRGLNSSEHYHTILFVLPTNGHVYWHASVALVRNGVCVETSKLSRTDCRLMQEVAREMLTDKRGNMVGKGPFSPARGTISLELVRMIDDKELAFLPEDWARIHFQPMLTP